VPVPFRGDFVLRVTGDSMIDAGILHGDMVVVRRQQSADDGEIVVALLEDGEATVKRLRRSDGRVVLQPENAAYAPIVAEEVRILGKVVGLVRGIS
jgi:repressor LexA